MVDLRGAVVVGSADQSAARCVVCGNDVAAGEGLAARWQGRTLRFRCLGCLARFEANPERYLLEHAIDYCRMDDADHPAPSLVSTETLARIRRHRR